MTILQANGSGEAPKAFPPPGLFVPQRVSWARPLAANELPSGLRAAAKHQSAAHKAGLAYQRRIEHEVSERFMPAWDVRIGPWFMYSEEVDGKRRYCQPDILMRDPVSQVVVAIEVKRRWSASAWFQLTKLYVPVVEAAHSPPKVFRLCICKSYDPADVIEEAVTFVDGWGAPLFPNAFNLLVVR